MKLPLEKKQQVYHRLKIKNTKMPGKNIVRMWNLWFLYMRSIYKQKIVKSTNTFDEDPQISIIKCEITRKNK